MEIVDAYTVRQVSTLQRRLESAYDIPFQMRGAEACREDESVITVIVC